MNKAPPPMDRETRDKAFAAVRSAMRKFNAGQPQDEICVFCAGPLSVEGLPPGGPYTMWATRCPCGKSNGMFKGL